MYNKSLLLLSILIVGSCYCQSNTSSFKPGDIKDGIKIGSLDESGINRDSIGRLETEIASGIFPNIHSLLIYKNNNLVYENYFPGKDENWGSDLGIIEHSPNDLHDMRSISKSVVSACVGICISDGKIRSVGQRVFDFFPGYAAFDTGMKKDLTIEHLLTMTSGLEWNEEVPYNDPANSEIRMTESKDPVGFILSQPMVASPGSIWKYNGGTTQLLAFIIEKVSGIKVDSFAAMHIFKPLGISQYQWISFPGTNNPAAASGLRLRSRDLLKFGIMYQDKGMWQGKKIVDSNWIKKSFQMFVRRPNSSGGYGYQFWIFNDSINNLPVHIIAGVGNGDQRLFFIEKIHLLVVTTAGNYNIWTISNNAYAILRRIYSAVGVK